MNEQAMSNNLSEKQKKLQAMMAKNTQDMLALNGRHVGETVYIIGAGPHLNELSVEQLQQLDNRITIGLNRTQFKIDLKYFLSAYVFEAEMAKRCRKNCTAIHIRPMYQPPLLPFIHTLKREYYQDSIGLPCQLKEPAPTLYTFKNVALAATHFAMILGVKRIVYIGVQKRNYLHFYQRDESLKRMMANYLVNLYSREMMSIDHPGKSVQQQLNNLAKDPDEVENTPDQFEHIVKDKFVHYFEHLRQDGIEYISTVEDSILCDAGAPYRPLEEVL